MERRASGKEDGSFLPFVISSCILLRCTYRRRVRPDGLFTYSLVLFSARSMLRSFTRSFSQRLVKCPEIKAMHGFKGRVASGLSEKEYNEDVGRHALVNFLYLVLFLDRAKVKLADKGTQTTCGSALRQGYSGWSLYSAG